MAAAEGLDDRLDDMLRVSAVDAHRLLHLALDEGGQRLRGRAQGAGHGGVLPAQRAWSDRSTGTSA
ncbi:MAG: hypothetical protein H0V42_12895 [Nocardioidaceae bacterium]|nr:hypothetical protein [Nocardioidaceae bacterium]